MRKQAEEFKATGNNYFNQSSFQESIDAYTKGIDMYFVIALSRFYVILSSNLKTP